MRETSVTSPDGTELEARCSGSGSPLVLVHGAMADRDSFALVEERLAGRHTVWVYSRRGRGGSGDGLDYILEREVEDVLAVLAAAGEGAHLFGHSSGAFYALLAAPRARGLRSLALYEPPLHADGEDAGLLEGVESALKAGEPSRAVEHFLPVAGITEQEAGVLRAEEPIWETLCEGIRVFPRELRALQAEGRGRLSAYRPPDVPVLYLYGEETEGSVYPTLDEVAALFPDARFHELPGQRHLAPLFDPASFAEALLAFTASHDG